MVWVFFCFGWDAANREQERRRDVASWQDDSVNSPGVKDRCNNPLEAEATTSQPEVEEIPPFEVIDASRSMVTRDILPMMNSPTFGSIWKVSENGETLSMSICPRAIVFHVRRIYLRETPTASEEVSVLLQQVEGIAVCVSTILNRRIGDATFRGFRDDVCSTGRLTYDPKSWSAILGVRSTPTVVEKTAAELARDTNEEKERRSLWESVLLHEWMVVAKCLLNEMMKALQP